jgi:NADH-quinone oxidoreductase subunit E
VTFSDTLEKRIARLLGSYAQKRSALVPMLMYVQDELGSLTDEAITEVAARIGCTVLQVNEVIGYYSMMHKKPHGKYHVQVCTNISCMLRGGFEIWDHAQKKLGIRHKETDAAGQFSLEEVECIGSCCWAPAMQVNYDYHHNVTREDFDKIVAGLSAELGGKK